MKNGLSRILNDLDSAGRGRKRDEEEGGTRRKEGRGGRMDAEEGATRRVKNEKIVKKNENEKVARGRIVDPRGLVFYRRNSPGKLMFFNNVRTHINILNHL